MIDKEVGKKAKEWKILIQVYIREFRNDLIF